jgi:hypothetical protein
MRAAAKIIRPHAEKHAEGVRLEAWAASNPLPSFETAASPPPQDEAHASGKN